MNSHVVHTSAPWNYSCSVCHRETTTSAGEPYEITFATNHANGSYDVKGSQISNYTYIATGSSCTPTCHTATYWGGPKLKCADCHMLDTTDVDNYVYNDTTKAKISSDTPTGWYGTGHGKTSGNYESGNEAANLINAAGTLGTGCAYCHDYQNKPHTDSRSGFFRLYVSSDNTVCRWCHGGPTAPGFNPSYDTGPEGTLNLKNAVGGVKGSTVATAHVGLKHSVESGYSDGGMFCWDCHDPHGDYAGAKSIGYMIHLNPSVLTEGTTGATWTAYGVPRSTTITGGSVALGTAISSFTKTGGNDTNAFDCADCVFPNYTGVCQVCHGAGAEISHYDQGEYDKHEISNTLSCVKKCHSHNDNFKGAGECVTCHNSAQTNGVNVPRRAIVSEFENTNWTHMRSNLQKTTKVTNQDCAVCHLEANADGSPNSAYHKVAPYYIDLKDPESGLQISSRPVSFRRNTTSSNLEVYVSSVQNQLCLKCHDSNGLSGDMSPFYSSTGTPINVYAQFSATVTYHPVLKSQNNMYCDQYTMNIFNQVDKTTTSAGNLISCWDCHIATQTAHGGNQTLRAAYSRTGEVATPLCVLCHKSSIYWAAAAADELGKTAFDGSFIADAHHPATGATRHAPAGSGITTAWTCISCHSSSFATQPARPRAAEDTHGFNTLVGGGNWPITASASTGSPPFSFFRVTTELEGWRPRSWPGESAGEGGGYCSGNTNTHCGRQHSTTYTPGGAY